MLKHYQFEKLQGYAQTQSELTAKESSADRETLEKSLQVEFSDEALTKAHYQDVCQLLENYRSEDCDLEEILLDLEDLYSFLETGLLEREKTERPPELSDVSLVADDLVRHAFTSWLDGLEELIAALQQDEEHRVSPALEQLKDGNRSLAKLDLLLREQGITEADAAAAEALS